MNFKRKLTMAEAVLISILFLVFLLGVMVLFTLSGVSPSRARQTTCASNQKMMMLAMQMIMEENERSLLPTDKELWEMTVECAENGGKYLVCPEFKNSKEVRARKGNVFGYGYNAKLSGKKISYFKDPKTIIVTADAAIEDNLIKSISDVDFERHKRDTRKSAVVSFLDGHVSTAQAISPDIFLEPQLQNSEIKE